jgi:hypothetical protein
MLTDEPIFGMQSAESIDSDSRIVTQDFVLVDGRITAYAPNGGDPVFASNPVENENGLLSFHRFKDDGPPAEVYCELVRSENLISP